jgi:hypothetical protein
VFGSESGLYAALQRRAILRLLCCGKGFLCARKAQNPDLT